MSSIKFYQAEIVLLAILIAIAGVVFCFPPDGLIGIYKSIPYIMTGLCFIVDIFLLWVAFVYTPSGKKEDKIIEDNHKKIDQSINSIEHIIRQQEHEDICLTRILYGALVGLIGLFIAALLEERKK